MTEAEFVEYAKSLFNQLRDAYPPLDPDEVKDPLLRDYLKERRTLGKKCRTCTFGGLQLSVTMDNNNMLYLEPKIVDDRSFLIGRHRVIEMIKFLRDAWGC